MNKTLLRYVIGSAKTCMIEKIKFLQKKPKSDKAHANKKKRKVENSYLLPFLCLSLKYEANTAACSRVTTRKTMVPFSTVLRLDSQLQNARENPLPIKTLTYEWNVSLRSYVHIRVLEKK